MSALRYLVPNAFTALSLVFGLPRLWLAVRSTDAVGWFILWGVLLDKLDGAAARLLKASSEFGVQLTPSLISSSSAAPAALVYYRLSACPNTARAATRFSGRCHSGICCGDGLSACTFQHRGACRW